MNALRTREVPPSSASTGEAVPLLDVRGLDVHFADGKGGHMHAVRDLGFTLGRERLAIVGESGSGKSTVVRALLGLLPATARRTAGHARFLGTDLLGLDAEGLRRLRGRHIAMVVQDPRQGLNPLMRIGDQVAEMLRAHRGLGRRAAATEAVALLDQMHIRDPARVARLYPHEVSGGMGQRAMIAMMLAGEPQLLIADEATSALDAVVQRHIVALLDEQVRQRDMGLVMISHDLALVARTADRILVMYAGRVVEELRPQQGRLDARHPYTQGLLACRPSPAHAGKPLPVLHREAAWLQ